jgi:hypothetical protein
LGAAVMAPALGPAKPDPWVLALKANRPGLLEEVRLLLDDPEAAPNEVATTDGDHGRIETRRAVIVHDVAWLADSHGFPGLKAIGKVTATREQDGRTTTATRTYLLSGGSPRRASSRWCARTGTSRTASTGCWM